MRHNTVVIAVCKVGTCQLSLQIKQVGQQYMIVNVSTEQTVNVRMYIGSWHKTFYLTCISKKHCRIILRHFADSASNLQSLSGQTVMPFIDHKVQNCSIVILSWVHASQHYEPQPHEEQIGRLKEGVMHHTSMKQLPLTVTLQELQCQI